MVAACVWLATMPNKAQDTASTEKESTHNVTDQKLPRESKTIIAVLLVASFVTFLNETILGVALPDIMKQLRIEPSTGQWLTTAFMLTMAVVIPTTGWIMQRLSTRMVYILALTLFSLGTLMAAVSGNFELLLLGRVLQACGTAIMMPLTMTTIMQVVPEHSRGKIMGTVSIVMSLAPALGPTISGLVLSFADWRAIFWLVLPIAVGALVIGGSKIHNHTDSQRISLDFMSVALAALAFGGTIYGLSDFGDAARGTAPIAPGIPLTAGLVMMALFIWRQIVLQKTDSALLDLRVFLAPPAGAVAWRVLRKDTDTFTGPSDPDARTAFAGADRTFLDDTGLIDGTAVWYRAYYWDGAAWAASAATRCGWAWPSPLTATPAVKSR